MAPAGVVLGLALGTVGSLIVELVGQAGGSTVAHPTPTVSIIADIVFDLGFVTAALYLCVLRGRVRPSDFGFIRVAISTGAKAVVLAAIAYYAVTAVYASVFQLHGSDKLPSELGAAFLRRYDNREETQKAYALDLADWFVWLRHAGVEPFEVTLVTVEAYMREPFPSGKPPAPSTMARRLACLSHFYRRIVYEGRRWER